MNTNSTISNFNLSKSFSWNPPFYEKAHDLGVFLRQKYANAELSDDTEKLKNGDIYILNSGGNFTTADLLKLARQKSQIAIIADTKEKKIIEDWCIENIRSSEQSWKKTYFVRSMKTLSGFLASSFYLNPSSKITISAVTGTNGKTTVVNAAAKAFAECEGACASLGTLGLIIYKKVLNNVVENQILEFGMTTPSAVSLQRYLNFILAQGISRLILEASSIGLVQGRLLSCKIKNAVLTNIGHDHLDFHGSYDELSASKVLLFSAPDLEKAIFVESNKTSFEAFKGIKKTVLKKLDSYLVSAAKNKNQSDVNLKINSVCRSGTEVSFEYRSKLIDKFLIPTIGTHNIENAAIVAGLLLIEAVQIKKIVSVLKKFQPPAGRMKFFQNKNCPLVCVDYAHTPEAFEQTLSTLKSLVQNTKGKLLCVFGCGGDRDKIKRPLMGRIAAKYCDSGYITSDNPRSENIKSINEQILMGINESSRSKWVLSENRGSAITEAISKADNDDLILVAGKGHENYQIIKTKKIFLDDSVEVQSAFKIRNKN